jgi:hypothetical protein
LLGIYQKDALEDIGDELEIPDPAWPEYGGNAVSWLADFGYIEAFGSNTGDQLVWPGDVLPK